MQEGRPHYVELLSAPPHALRTEGAILGGRIILWRIHEGIQEGRDMLLTTSNSSPLRPTPSASALEASWCTRSPISKEP